MQGLRHRRRDGRAARLQCAETAHEDQARCGVRDTEVNSTADSLQPQLAFDEGQPVNTGELAKRGTVFRSRATMCPAILSKLHWTHGGAAAPFSFWLS